jgi:hypothetical protein
MGAALSAALALSVLSLPGPAHARDPVAEGRNHLRKANALAGNDRCEAAIKEYTLAYARLHDPVVLFNRAECYRRIGEDASAAADYRGFLKAVPAAPNRAEVEAKIAALDLTPRPVATAAAPREAPAGSSPPAPRPMVIPPMATQSLVAPATPADLSAAPLVGTPAASEPPVVPPSTAETSGSGHRGGLWMWAALGTAVVGGAVVAYFVLRVPVATPPSTELGNYRF